MTEGGLTVRRQWIDWISLPSQDSVPSGPQPQRHKTLLVYFIHNTCAMLLFEERTHIQSYNA